MAVTATKTESQILALTGAQTYNLTQAPTYNYSNPVTLSLTGNALTFSVSSSNLQAEGGSLYGGNTPPTTYLFRDAQHGPTTIIPGSPVEGFGLLLDTIPQFTAMHFTIEVYVSGALDQTYTVNYTGFGDTTAYSVGDPSAVYTAPYFGVAVVSGTAGIDKVIVSATTDDNVTVNDFCMGRFSIGSALVSPSGTILPPESIEDLDIRFYAADGTRIAVPRMDSLNFELGEQGGMQNGSFQTLAPWEQLQFAGTEYVDVRLWGQFMYRGWIWEPQNELASSGERVSPTLHGCMEFLNGYLVRRDFHYAPAKEISLVCTDIFNAYVSRAGRQPTEIDVTGVSGLGIMVSDFTAKGKTVAQAMNALCELAPGQLIWGCDVNTSTNANRLYLRPRIATINYKFGVGKDVTAFVYPRDFTKIVNRIYLTGGKLLGTDGQSQPNLLPNASFEDTDAVGELTSNVLENGSFDEDSSTLAGWGHNHDVVAPDFGRTGANGAELNNDGGDPEFINQDIPVASNLTKVHASCYWNTRLPVTATNQIKFELFSGGSGGTLIQSSTQSPVSMPVTGGYVYYRYYYEWSPAAGTYDTLRVSYILASDSDTGYAGQTIIDDCSVWFDNPNASKSWRVYKGVGGAWSSIDWQNHDITPFDGDVCVKAVSVNCLSNTKWAEIAVATKDRPTGHPRRAYFLVFRAYAPGGSIHCSAGARVYSGGALKTVSMGAVTLVGADWYEVTCAFTTGNECDALEPFFRVYDNGTVYLDAAGMYIDATAAPTFYSAGGSSDSGDDFAYVRATTDYTSADIGVEAAASIATYGEREAEVSNSNVVDGATLDAFAKDYFRANAVPSIQAKLTLFGANAPVKLDGQVRLLNLPSSPPALNPTRIHYTIGRSIDIECDLGSEPPSLANLLRLVTAGRA